MIYALNQNWCMFKRIKIFRVFIILLVFICAFNHSLANEKGTIFAALEMPRAIIQNDIDLSSALPYIAKRSLQMAEGKQ